MDYSMMYVSALLEGGKMAWRKSLDRGISAEYLSGPGKQAMEFVTKHATQYGELPSVEMVYSKTGIQLAKSSDTLDSLIDTILDARLFQQLSAMTADVTERLVAKQPKEGLQKAQKLLSNITADGLGGTQLQSMFDLMPDVLDIYENMKKGERGIPFPWEGLNTSTMGIWPQDFILFVARLGLGKTFCLLQIAEHAWMQGYRVLLLTTEMAKVRMAQRFIALHEHLHYSAFRRGELPSTDEDRMIAAMKELKSKDDKRFILIGGDFDFRMDNLSAIISQELPDLVVLDGAYLVITEGVSRTDKAAAVFTDLKRIANRTGVPIVASSQFNREVKKNEPKSAQIESIGLSDVGGWSADCAWALVQTDDMKKDRRMLIKPLKIREGLGEDVELNWDVDRMTFTEIASMNTGSDIDQYGTGVRPPQKSINDGLFGSTNDDGIPF